MALAWLAVLLPSAGGISGAAWQSVRAGAQTSPDAARRRHRVPGPGEILFLDPSPKPSGHDLSRSTYVGYQVCAGCHGALDSTRPHHTIIQEWEAATNGHSRDAASLPGPLNVYESDVVDGLPLDGPKQCAVCHATGAPDFNQPQTAVQGGFDPSLAWNEHMHNVRFLRVQCEACHGPGSQHVLTGGDPNRINRIPDARRTCWKCHVHTPDEKGNTLLAAATDEQTALYHDSLLQSSTSGALITGRGGYEYAGEHYDKGHDYPHTQIADSCVTCHTYRDRRSPTLDHSTLKATIAVCRNCHGDARSATDLDHWDFLRSRQDSIRRQLITLGGAGPDGSPDPEARGGLLGNAADRSSPEYRRARWNYSLVLNDRSLGAHDMEYASELMATTIRHAPAQAAGGP